MGAEANARAHLRAVLVAHTGVNVVDLRGEEADGVGQHRVSAAGLCHIDKMAAGQQQRAENGTGQGIAVAGGGWGT